MRLRWTGERADRFTRDWNLGLDAEALREKYGVKRLDTLVRTLRDRGFVLKRRRRNGEVEG